jgi:1-aminocyclopropane-1-carboxylate deaminase/D-cysteine desulfhydrase-like pyridoxal-dependent ACC family enzyme
MHFPRFARMHFAHLPTPLEPLPRLSAALGALGYANAALELSVHANERGLLIDEL